MEMTAGSIQIYRYRLIPRGQDTVSEPARRGGRAEFSGVLLRDAERGGIGCIHPWPELGDASLEQELDALRRGRPLGLGKRALQCMAIDGTARERGVSLFSGLQIPASHYLWQGERDAICQAHEIAAGGFPAVKLKLGSERHLALASVARVADAVDVPLRLDFNAVLTASEAVAFFRGMSADLRARIELVEDPCPYDPGDWGRLRCAFEGDLALDRGLRLDGCGLPEGATLGVFKPARDDGDMLGAGRMPLLVTSYMDHPIGQMWAAWWAARIAAGDFAHIDFRGCGLLTHGHFAGDAALGLVEQEGARLLPPSGMGLGFDDYLEGLAWKNLE